MALFFSNFLRVACPQTPYEFAKGMAKGMASLSCGHVQRIALTHANLHFRKKYLDPLSNFVCSPDIHVQMN